MLNSLLPFKKKRKRIGRGISAGGGNTAGRGTKGQKARAGKKLRPTFEGGQTPFFMKIPKLRGFRNVNHISYQPVNLKTLEAKHTETEVTAESLFAAKLIDKQAKPVKILGNGTITKKFNIKAESISTSALEKLQKAGGTFTSTARSNKKPKTV